MKKIALSSIFFTVSTLLVLTLLVPTAVAQEEPVKIGFFSPLSGFAAADGRSALYGAQIAVDFINENGGINGREVKLIHYDDAAQADQAASIARKLIERDKIDIGVSGSYSTPTRAAAGIFQSSNVPLISAYAVHPSIIETGDLISRVGMGAPVQGVAGAILAVEELGVRKIAILTIDNDFGVSLSEHFKEKAVELGAEIVFEKKFSLGESEFRGLLGSVKDANPELIYATGYFSEAAHLVSQAREMGIQAPIIGQEGYDSPKFIELAGRYANRTIITTDLNRDSDREIVHKFLEGYKERAGVPGDMVGASAFDGVQVAAYAIEKAGTDPQAIMSAINGIKNLDTVVTGPFYEFKGREAIRPIEVQIVRGGEFHEFMVMKDKNIIYPPTD
ncbi:ABC transporter substrate-binding protein [Candidatus Bipolaricaulota bacterium]|nr:ABC transporter substrate-binding protein [Candidatus Bipolaricaulota bacterium]